MMPRFQIRFLSQTLYLLVWWYIHPQQMPILLQLESILRNMVLRQFTLLARPRMRLCLPSVKQDLPMFQKIFQIFLQCQKLGIKKMVTGSIACLMIRWLLVGNELMGLTISSMVRDKCRLINGFIQLMKEKRLRATGII